MKKTKKFKENRPENYHVHDRFFTTSLLYWIEVLVLTRNLGAGVYAMNDIEQWYTLVSFFWVVHWNVC